MSLTLGIDQVIYYLFEPHRENPVAREDAMIFSFDVCVTSFSKGQSFSRRQSIHFLLYSPYGGSVYTYFAVDNNPFKDGATIEPDRWANICNHDSCWRNTISDKIHEVYFNMCDSINLDRESFELPTEAPIKMSQFNSPSGISRPLYKLVKITQKNDEFRDNNPAFISGYWKKLTSITNESGQKSHH